MTRPRDAGPPLHDAGRPLHDAGTPLHDAGTPLDDAVARRGTPVWVRAVLALDRTVRAGARLEAALRDELLCALLDPRARDALTSHIYERAPRYRASSAAHRAGLTAWELAAVTTPPFPGAGRLLLGASGGGRELVALEALGYAVVAFEPTDLADDAARVASSSALVRRGSYADLVRAARSGDGPLADVARAAPFDAVVLGHGSLSHVLDAPDRVALLAALHALAPRAPVLASFHLRPVDETAPGALRRAIRGALRRLTARTPAHDAGLRFYPWAGFLHAFAPSEIAPLARAGGYDVARFSPTPYPHALLVPR